MLIESQISNCKNGLLWLLYLFQWLFSQSLFTASPSLLPHPPTAEVFQVLPIVLLSRFLSLSLLWSLWQSPTWYSCLQSLLSLVVFPHWSNTGIYLPEDHRWLTLAHRSEYNLLNMILMPSPIFIITLSSSTSLKPWTLTTSVFLHSPNVC